MIGTIVDDRFRVESLIGSGAMAQVFLVTDVLTERTAAMKVLSPDYCTKEESVRRFEREYKVCARLDHPNVVKIFSLGVLPDGARYYTMEHLPHPSLQVILQREGRLTFTRTRRLLCQAASALACFHPLGVIHRDLKPANLIVSDDGRLVVVDFGLVRDATLTALTITGSILGTPYYMPPEMLTNHMADERCDIWALGVIAYEMLSGKRPFEAQSMPELLRCIADLPHKPLSELVWPISPRWVAIVDRCLAKQPDDRYPSAAALLADLESLDSASQPHRPAQSETDDDLTPPPPSEPRAVEPSSGLPGHHVILPLVAALLLTCLVAALSWPTRGTAEARRYQARKIVVESLPDALVVSWQSGLAYPSRLQLSASPPRLFASHASTAVTSHVVHVGPLKEATRYTFRIIFPHGASLPRTAATASVKLENLTTVATATGLRLSWLCPYGKEATVSTAAPGRLPTTVAAVRGPGDQWTVLLEPLSAVTRGLEVSLRLRSGRTRRLDLAAFLRAELHRLAKPLATFDAETFFRDSSFRLRQEKERTLARYKRDSGLAELPGDTVREIVNRVGGRFFLRLMKERGIGEAYGQLLRLCPLAFNTSIISREQQLLLYRYLTLVIKLALYTDAVKYQPKFELPALPSIGDFTFSLQARPGASRSLLLVDNARTRPDLGPVKFLAYYPSTKLECTFDIDNPANFTAADLVLTVDSFDNQVIQARVNDNFVLTLYDRPLMHEERYEGEATLVQRVPLWFLRRGVNTLSIGCHQIFVAVCSESTTIRSIRLNLHRRD